MSLIFAILTTFSCCPKHLPPVETHINVRDSVAIFYRDSVVIIPTERIVDIVRQYDSLFLETSLAKAVAYVDTNTHSLKGTIENKKEIQYKYIYKTEYKYRDSIQIREVPVEIEVEKVVMVVPWWAKILSWIGGISLAVAAGFVISKFV